MRIKLTEAQRRCLEWYEATRSSKAAIPARPGWNMRQVDKLLSLDFLHVGPQGWHVPTDAGLAALAAE